MFADSFDGEKAAKKEQERKEEEAKQKEEEALMNLDEVIKWEFRWENKDDAEVHGPHTSEEMLKWQVRIEPAPRPLSSRHSVE
jgi:CD2 antigen cytoplasmic tail-binding protein 2